MSVRVIWSIVLVISAVSVLILSGLFIHVQYGVLKSSTIVKIFIYLLFILAVLGLCCCTWAFCSCAEWGLL